jgi:hypothetical protein
VLLLRLNQGEAYSLFVMEMRLIAEERETESSRVKLL